MPEGTPAVTEERAHPFLRRPFLWGGLAVALLLGAILLLARPSSSGTWPPALYLSADDAAASRWNLHDGPGGPILPLDWSSMTTSTSVGPSGPTAFELSIKVHYPAKDPVRKVLMEIGPWREPSRTYATKGEAVERDGGRWYVLRPE